MAPNRTRNILQHLKIALIRFTTSVFLFITIISCQPDIIIKEDEPPTAFTIKTEIIEALVMRVSWDESVDPEGGKITYSLLLEDQSILTDSDQRSYTFKGLEAGKEFSGKVVATDAVGNRTIIDFTLSTELITVPIEVKDFYSSSVGSESKVGGWIHWQPVISEEARYTVKLNGIVLAKNIDDTKYKFVDLQEGTSYTVGVTASLYDQDFEEHFEFVTPIAPSPFTVHVKYAGYTSALYTWSKSTASDGSLVVYDLYFGPANEPLPLVKTNSTDTSFLINNLPLNGGGHQLLVRAKGANNLIRHHGAWIAPRPILDLSKNAPIINFYNVSNASARISARLTGEIKTGAIDGIKYECYLNDNLLSVNVCQDQPYIFDKFLNLEPNTSYSLRIKIANPGNPNEAYEDPLSNEIVFTSDFLTPDYTLTEQLALEMSDVTQTSATLLLKQEVHGGFCFLDESYRDFYKIYLDEELVGEVNPLERQTQTFINLTPSKLYTVRVVHHFMIDSHIYEETEKTIDFVTNE